MLEEKIRNHEAVVGVIGLGYVGLPLLLAFHENGFRVLGFDVDESKPAMLKEGKSYLKHIGKEMIAPLVGSPNFDATNDFSRLPEADALLICVPTPLDKHRDPDLSYVESTARTISEHLRKGQLVILESTTYPGTTEELVKPILEESGLVCEKDFYLAFSPEREDPGNKNFNTKTIPKVVGGVGEMATKLAVQLYSEVITSVHPVSSPAAAEMTKLLENIFRSVNIALVNEMKIVADKMGVDIWEVIEAAKTKPFGFMAFYPGPGLGGHCIPIDPFYLTWKAREYGISTRFIELAGEINTYMPTYVIEKLVWALNSHQKSLKGAKVLVLGVAYKPDIDDLRESPALEIMELLAQWGADMSYNDPYIPALPKTRKHCFGMESVELTPEVLSNSDAVLIATDHSSYDYEFIAKHANLIVDTRNATGKSGVYEKYSNKIVKA